MTRLHTKRQNRSHLMMGSIIHLMLAVTLYSLTANYALADCLPNECCQQNGDTCHCPKTLKLLYEPDPYSKSFHCDDSVSCLVDSPSQTPSNFEATYKYFREKQPERSGIVPVNLVSGISAFRNYAEDAPDLPEICLSIHFSLYRSPPISALPYQF